MNKYLICVCDLIAAVNDKYVFTARSLADAQDKIMQSFIHKYDMDEYTDYDEFIDKADKLYDLCFSEIIDIETL